MEERLKEIVETLGDEESILRLLTPDERRELAGHFESRFYPAGTVCCREDEQIGFLGIIASGKLRFERTSETTGRPVAFAVLGRGSHIGDFSTMHGRDTLGQLTAAEDTELLVVPHEKLERYMDEHPRAGLKILKGLIAVLTRRLRFAIDIVVTRS